MPQKGFSIWHCMPSKQSKGQERAKRERIAQVKGLFEGVGLREAGATDHASAREILRVYDGTFDHTDNHRDNFAASHSLPSTQHRLPRTLSHYTDSIIQHCIPGMAHIFGLPLELVHMILQYLCLGIIDKEPSVSRILVQFSA